MVERTLLPTLIARARQAPVVTVTGPRQSGKTTLVRQAFPRHSYASLEDPELREHALADPRSFLRQFSGPAILDEAQRAPQLFSYLQGLVDDQPEAGRFILSGSQNFLLMRSIRQSLAGRTALLHLLPFSLSELEQRPGIDLEQLNSEVAPAPVPSSREVWETLWTGFYPRIHDRGLDPQVWLADYTRTYVERDVREVLQIGDLEAFGRYVRLCAGRSGQLLNLSSLATDCGISHSTAQRWLSILEASFLVALLRPHHQNLGKRLIKAPKLYFLDTGLLCYLLRIRDPEELRFHAARGAVFESFVVADLLKGALHRGQEPALHFWRDSTGHEVDVLLDFGSRLLPVEVKAGETLSAEAFDRLNWWRRLAGAEQAPAALIYAGARSYRRGEVEVLSWAVL